MKITFLGAAKTVTGSCYLVETEKSKFLVDCGMFQGHNKETAMNAEAFPFNPSDLNFILLTHSHIDHSGRIPKIYMDGFKGDIITTKASKELCAIMLPDSGHIQEMEAEWINRKRLRAGKHPIKPLYTFQDAVDCIKLFKSVKYGIVENLDENVRVRFNDAGHILGSAILEIWINENNEETKIVFSGDLGNKDIPILRDPSFIESTDYLVIESTYGNRLHDNTISKVDRFVNIINETIEKGGNIIIPSFAVGRTQEIIYDLHKQREKYGDKLNKLFSIPVIVDSPLAISATEVFRNNLDCFDEEAREYIKNGDNPLDFSTLQFTKTADESRALNERTGSSIIISASGMCDAGRIKHHLKHNLWRQDSTILFVGYQAVGTLGRSLVDGAKNVKIFGEEISVNSRIEMIDGFSGHADKDGLLGWIEKFNQKPKKIFIVHGEEEVQKIFSGLITQKFSIEAIIPAKGESYTINAVSVLDVEKPEESYALKKLALIDVIEKIKDEFEEISEHLKKALKEGKNDNEIEVLKENMKSLETHMAELLK